jgi:hypothetical protein
MKALKLVALVFLGILATGCEKKKNPQDVAAMPGGGTTVITKYAGTITSDKQDVATNADVIGHPTDGIEAYVCRGTPCSVDALPAKTCAQIYPDLTSPCYTTTPSPYFAWGVNIVRLLYGVQVGYTSYAIQTTVTR